MHKKYKMKIKIKTMTRFQFDIFYYDLFQFNEMLANFESKVLLDNSSLACILLFLITT